MLKTFERRKLLLSCLLMRQPRVLLMDEPAAGLINAEIDEIDQILRMLSKEMKMAVLIVEHRIELLETIADRVIVMDAGEIIARGELGDIINSPAVRAAYFEAALTGSMSEVLKVEGSVRRLWTPAGDP